MKYRIEHIRFISGQGKSYNETIDNTNTVMTANELAEFYGDYCEDGDWIEQIDNETNKTVSKTDNINPVKYFLDFDPFDFDKFTLYTCSDHNEVYAGRLSEIVKDGEDWQSALDAYFAYDLDISPKEWVIG